MRNDHPLFAIPLSAFDAILKTDRGRTVQELKQIAKKTTKTNPKIKYSHALTALLISDGVYVRDVDQAYPMLFRKLWLSLHIVGTPLPLGFIPSKVLVYQSSENSSRLYLYAQDAKGFIVEDICLTLLTVHERNGKLFSLEANPLSEESSPITLDDVINVINFQLALETSNWNESPLSSPRFYFHDDYTGDVDIPTRYQMAVNSLYSKALTSPLYRALILSYCMDNITFDSRKITDRCSGGERMPIEFFEKHSKNFSVINYLPRGKESLDELRELNER